MDHEMPFMDGNQASKKIISFLHEHNIPKPVLISVSGSQGVAFEKQCKESGIDYILRKPVDGQELKEIIEYINFPR
jgi:CheY-like chemotaxis protein